MFQSAATTVSRQAAIPKWAARRIAILASLTLTVLAAAAALILVQGVDRQLQDVVSTYEVRGQAREVSLSMSEAESSQRAYLLTLDEQYLAPFRQASAAVETQLDHLVALTENEEARSQRVSDLIAEVRRKRAEMEASVTLVSEDRADQAQALMQSGAGMRLMEEVREAIGLFMAEEDQRLLARNAEIQATRIGLTAAIIAALAGAAILAYMLLHRTERQVNALSARQSVLVTANEELESRVNERTAELDLARQHAERERERVETLLRDTNHRIGNSLATVSSLLGLQVMRAKSEEARVALEAARDRVQTIASGHRRLRLGADLETVRMDEFLNDIIEDHGLRSQDLKPEVRIEAEIEPLVVPARDATTIGIIVGELITNALKYAFVDRPVGRVAVRFHRDHEGALLSVEDDGIGMPVEPGDGSGLGSVITAQLARQYGGAVKVEPGPTGGTRVSLNLPDLDTSEPD